VYSVSIIWHTHNYYYYYICLTAIFPHQPR